MSQSSSANVSIHFSMETRASLYLFCSCSESTALKPCNFLGPSRPPSEIYQSLNATPHPTENIIEPKGVIIGGTFDAKALAVLLLPSESYSIIMWPPVGTSSDRVRIILRSILSGISTTPLANSIEELNDVTSTQLKPGNLPEFCRPIKTGTSDIPRVVELRNTLKLVEPTLFRLPISTARNTPSPTSLPSSRCRGWSGKLFTALQIRATLLSPVIRSVYMILSHHVYSRETART